MILVSECWVLSQLFHSLISFSLRKCFFTFCHKDGVICVLRLLILLLAILISACASSSLAFCMMYSANKLNKHSDNIQPCYIPFPILNQSIVPHPVLTVSSWPAYRFLRRQVKCTGILISLKIFHSFLWSTQSLSHSQWSRCFSGILWLSLWSSEGWQFDLWFLCLL